MARNSQTKIKIATLYVLHKDEERIEMMKERKIDLFGSAKKQDIMKKRKEKTLDVDLC